MTGWGLVLAVAVIVGCAVAPVLVGWAINVWCTRRRLARCRAADLRCRVDEIRDRNRRALPGPAEPYRLRPVPGRVAS
ncbi:hypothetical protein [Alloactinosynnema sp. L-07]|uniref:hypothetical protein n=1 Tax=Alloactinosynnema sp. L-07 TaxID=1653480 RepID=UPI00065F0002|nr:hypothetical protein [Alloactinosynnema sp. L-07]CRK55881.1 hypothetical protein [Alloactinosynnema sp. L-07]